MRQYNTWTERECSLFHNYQSMPSFSVSPVVTTNLCTTQYNIIIAWWCCAPQCSNRCINTTPRKVCRCGTPTKWSYAKTIEMTSKLGSNYRRCGRPWLTREKGERIEHLYKKIERDSYKLFQSYSIGVLQYVAKKSLVGLPFDKFCIEISRAR